MQNTKSKQWPRVGASVNPLLTLSISAVLMMSSASIAGAQSSANSAVTTIRVGGSDAISSAAPYFAAQRQGYFKDAGLNVVYVTMSGGAAPMTAALKTGELDVGLGAASQYMGDIARGTDPGKIIGEFTDNNYAILAAKGITNVQQLKGKIFAIQSYNGGDHVYGMAVLGYYGITPDQMTWLPIGVPASRLSAIQSGKAQATGTTLTSLPESAWNLILIGPDDSPVPFVSNAIFVRQPFLNSDKPALQRFLAAIGKGSDWIRAHPDDAVAACEDSGGGADNCKLTIKVATASKNPYTWSSTSRVNVNGIKSMIGIMAADIPKAKTMTVDDFVDTSIAGTAP